MSTAEFFYPGFEHAGLETPLDRALTWTLCAAVLAAGTIGDLAGRVADRLRPLGAPIYDA